MSSRWDLELEDLVGIPALALTNFVALDKIKQDKSESNGCI